MHKKSHHHLHRKHSFSPTSSETGSGASMNTGNLGTVGALSLSVVSSVSIVLCNKQLMSGLGFNFGE